MDIRQSYEKINISEQAKNQIKNDILAGEKTVRKENCSGAYKKYGKIAVAAALALVLIVPSGVMAAGRLYRYFTTSIQKDKYSVTAEMNQTKGKKMKYIKVSADFGESYHKTERNKEFQCYENREGGQSGKDFWYSLQYLEGKQKEILSTYDVKENETMKINGRRAVYCRYNPVVGSKYLKSKKTDYGQTLYIFVEDYGYLIEMAAQTGLPKKEFVHLAEKIQITKAQSKAEAADFILYSKRSGGAWNVQQNLTADEKIDVKHYSTNGTAQVKNAVYEVKDVKVLDSANQLKTDAFIKKQASFLKHVNNDGKLNAYEREQIRYGNGITAPERSVIETKTVQPKLVYVTLAVKNSASVLKSGKFPVPSLQLVTKKDKQIFQKTYDDYGRPNYIEKSFTDGMPCYLEEKLTGKSEWFVEGSKGTIQLHFAYLVDEDELDGMALNLNDWSKDCEYLDISQG